MIPLILTLALAIPQPVTVDRIEINTFPSGESHVKQVILYRWTRLSTGYGYRVTDWWLVDSDYEPAGDLVARYKDGQLEEFTSQHITHTNTDHDPELRDRKILCPDDRVPYLKGNK
jgi:hypothetical protein